MIQRIDGGSGSARFRWIGAVLSWGLLSTSALAQPSIYPTAPVTLHGRVMNVFQVFGLTPPPDTVGAAFRRVLVVNDQVYGFLETPRNAQALRGVADGQAVRIDGQLIPDGHLIEIGTLTQVEGAGTALDALRSTPAEPVEINGRNMCQCGLMFEGVEATCELGHLHHLASPARLYSYLLDAQARGLFTGDHTHFQHVRVEGQVYGGFFLKVDHFTESPQ